MSDMAKYGLEHFGKTAIQVIKGDTDVEIEIDDNHHGYARSYIELDDLERVVHDARLWLEQLSLADEVSKLRNLLDWDEFVIFSDEAHPEHWKQIAQILTAIDECLRRVGRLEGDDEC